MRFSNIFKVNVLTLLICFQFISLSFQLSKLSTSLTSLSRNNNTKTFRLSSASIKSNEISSDGEDQRKKSLLPPWLPAFSTAALGGLLFGSDIGASSSVVRILGSAAGEGAFGALSAIQLGTIASSSLFGAMAASLALIQLGDKKIGRKTELITAAVLFTCGTILQSFAPSFIATIIGRIIYGLGIGVAMHVAPLFIAETAPTNIRGKLVSLKEAAIVGGIVLGYGAGALFGNDGNWRLVYESVLPLEALMLFGALSIPESPRWLALRNQSKLAIENLQRIQGISAKEATAAVEEMTKMNTEPGATIVSSSASSEEKNENLIEKVQEIWKSPYNRQALVIGVGLVLFQQLSGQPSVLYFANRIFEKAGLGYGAAVLVGVFKLAMTLISATLVENPKVGRKSLLLYGSGIMTASLTALTVLYNAPVGQLNQNAIIGCILLFVGGYQVGYGPITWLVLSEIFPLKVRSTAVSIGTLANFASNLLVALLFEIERQNFGESVLFLQFTVISAIATWFIKEQVFETRGLTLEEIEQKLQNVVDTKK